MSKYQTAYDYHLDMLFMRYTYTVGQYIYSGSSAIKYGHPDLYEIGLTEYSKQQTEVKI